METPGAQLLPSPDGGYELEFPGESQADDDVNIEFDENLAFHCTDEELTTLGQRVYEDYQADLQSRADWENTIKTGIDLLGIDFRKGAVPFEGACSAVHPLVIENSVKFQSKAIAELIPSSGPVRTQIVGVSDERTERQAQRVKNFMNYQIMEQMTEYYDDTERMLFSLSLMGSAFKKVWYDVTRERPVIEYIPLDRFVVNYYAQDLDRAERYTHLLTKSERELRDDFDSGRYKEIDLTPGNMTELSDLNRKVDQVQGLNQQQASGDSMYDLLEQHCYWKLKCDDEESLPYIITIDRKSNKVLGIYRNWEPNDPKRQKLNYFVHYKFVPGLGFYGLGYIHLIGNLTDSATAAMRSLIDAGQFATLPGGFKAKGLKITGGNDPISPGEFREVESSGTSLKDNIIPLPFKEPSNTLMAMLQFVTESGQKFADATEQVVADSSNYGPVATTMALLEQSTKFFSAIHKRLHKSQRDEFRILARINFWALPGIYPYPVEGAPQSIQKADFDGRIDVLPVSDPNVATQSHRLAMAQLQFQIASQSPQFHDMREVLRRVYIASGISDVDKILPPPQQARPMDPVSDIGAAVRGMPIAAFPGQDHQAHIAVKQSWLQDPMNGGSPAMQQIVPKIMANVQEHMMAKYAEEIQGLTRMLGPQAQMPGMAEKAQADAAQKVLVANQQAAQSATPADIEKYLAWVEGEKVKVDGKQLELQEKRDAIQAYLRSEELHIRRQDQEVKAVQIGADRITKANEQQLDRDAKLTSDVLNATVKLKTAKQKSVQKPK